jgi:hypothetical protein
MHNGKHNKLQLLIRKTLGFDKKEQRQPERMLSASKERPTISTLVYKAPEVEFSTSETFPQDKIIANAKQLLVALDHTTASMH